MSYHESLNEDTDDTLNTHNKYSFWALLIGSSGAVADSVLRFHGEEKASGKWIDVIETGNESGVGVWGRGIEVTVGEDDEPPDEGEH